MKTYHSFVMVAALFVVGCSKIEQACNGDHSDALNGVDAGDDGASALGSGGHDGSPACKRITDPHSGAETSDCEAPADPTCATMFCGDDGKCHEHDFPIGAVCSKTDTCDGMGTCKTLAVTCAGGCDDGKECTIDNCQASNGMCFYANLTEVHKCGGEGHCNRDTGECCEAAIVVEVDAMFPDFKYYHCAASCPVGQVADSGTGVCE